MRRLLIVLGLLAAVTSGAQANMPPGYFYTITDGAYSSRTWLNHAQISNFDIQSGQWGTKSNIIVGAQSLASGQAAGSDYSWLQGTRNNWYCVDLNSLQGGDQWWFYNTSAISETFGRPAGQYGTIEGLRRAAWLVTTYHNSGLGEDYQSTINRAALQLAVWEAVYDNQQSLALGGGVFKATLTGGLADDWSATTAQAATWYESSYEKSGMGVYAVDGQNMLGNVPEPSTLVLLGLSLTAAGVGFIRRRRKA